MRRLAVALLLTLTVAGCGSLQTYEGERNLNRREIPPGPGLFSGPAGKWIIVRQ